MTTVTVAVANEKLVLCVSAYLIFAANVIVYVLSADNEGVVYSLNGISI